MYSVTGALQPKRKARQPAGPARPRAVASQADKDALAAAAGAGFLLVHLAQPALGPHALHRIELPVHANAQLFGLAVQPAAALAHVAAITGLATLVPPLPPPLAVTRRPPGLTAAAIGAVQIAVVVADVANAAAHVGERTPLRAS